MENNVQQCLNCGRTEEELPLVAQRYRGHHIWICTACMPVVIHHPERVMARLAASVDQEGES